MLVRSSVLLAVVIFASHAYLGCSSESSNGSSTPSPTCPNGTSQTNEPAPSAGSDGNGLDLSSNGPCTTSASTEPGSGEGTETQGDAPSQDQASPPPKKDPPAKQCGRRDESCVSDWDCCSNSCDTWGTKRCY